MVGSRDSVLEIGIVQRQWSAGPLIPAKRACADKGRLSRMAQGGQSSHVPPSERTAFASRPAARQAAPDLGRSLQGGSKLPGLQTSFQDSWPRALCLPALGPSCFPENVSKRRRKNVIKGGGKWWEGKQEERGLPGRHTHSSHCRHIFLPLAISFLVSIRSCDGRSCYRMQWLLPQKVISGHLSSNTKMPEPANFRSFCRIPQGASVHVCVHAHVFHCPKGVLS